MTIGRSAEFTADISEIGAAPRGANHRSGSNIPTELGFKAMGIPRDAMTVAEISDAIPPAYSKFIAEKFLEQFAARDAAA